MAQKIRSFTAAVKIIERFYSKNLDKDKISNQEIFESYERKTETSADKKKNKQWLSNVLTHVKHHKLAEPVYQTRNNRKTLVGIELTEVGKRVLGRKISDNAQGQTPLFEMKEEPIVKKIGYDDMMQIVAKFQKENPQYFVKFSIELKGET